ncbi:hypothetical protein ACFL3E_00845 [Patescibacteria group bacterium]
MGYWDATDLIRKELGGRNPNCPECGEEMVAVDDHGRFECFSCGHGRPKYRIIPQVPADVELTDEQKQQIPPINRLHHTPTEEEKSRGIGQTMEQWEKSFEKPEKDEN